MDETAPSGALPSGGPVMRKRRIRKEDGRYLIFYHFDEVAAAGEGPGTSTVETAEVPPTEEATTCPK